MKQRIQPSRSTCLVVAMIAVCGIHAGAYGETVVDGPIESDTVWTAQQGPYRITNDIKLVQGATLTIEPGVVVEIAAEKTFMIDGRLVAIGEAERPITFTRASSEPWGHLHFTDFSDDAVVDDAFEYVSGSVLKHCVIEYGKGIFCRFGGPLIAKCTIRNNISSGIRVEHGGPVIVDNVIYGNSTELDPAAGNGAGLIAFTGKPMTIIRNVLRDNRSIDGRYGGGGICAYAEGDNAILVADNFVFNNYSSTHAGGIFAYNSTVRNNWVVGNECAERGGGIYVIEAEVIGNLVDSNQGNGGGGIYAENSTLSRNSIVRNRAVASYGGGVYFFGAGSVTENTVMHNRSDDSSNSAGLYVSGDPVIRDNTILSNRGYALFTGSPSHSPLLKARHNFWGSPAEEAIVAALHDWFDDSERGLVDYADPRDGAAEQAPPVPPTGLTAASKGKGVELRWTRGTGQDSLRYTVHVGTKPGYPYETNVDVGAKDTFVLTGLEAGVPYYATVTAMRDGGKKLVDHSAHSEVLKIQYSDHDAPAQPTNRSPGGGESGVSLKAAFSAGAFSDADGDAHAASRWQIASAAGGYGIPVLDTGLGAPGDTMTVPGGVLEYGARYTWRVSYQDAAGNWSPWSSETAFTTREKPATLLGGPISSDTTWTVANSPYVLAGNTMVSEGVTLTVEPGVTVGIVPDAAIMVRGELRAVGTADGPITFTRYGETPWGHLIFTDASVDAVLDDSGDFVQGSILEHCVVESGKGILIEASSPFITECDIRNHVGSGISIRKGGPWITGNRITGNQSPHEGGGIYVYTNDHARIRDNVIEGNSAHTDGGGVFAYGYRSTTAVTLRGNTVADNTAQGNGGGIYASRATIADNTFRGNQAGAGGGGVYTTFSIVDGNAFTGNTATEGGGIFGERNSTIRRNTVVDNTASSAYGGGVYINYWGRSVENEEFSFNEVRENRAASTEGNGGVYVNGILIFEKNNIFGNTGYALYNANTADLDPLEATECYWGASDPEAVEKAIFHNPDDDRLALVVYEPFAPEKHEAP